METIERINQQLRQQGITTLVDDRDNLKPGFKFAEHEMHGIPLRIAIGPKDIERQHAEVARRDTGEKSFIPWQELPAAVTSLLEAIQSHLYNRANDFLQEHITPVDSWEQFVDLLESKGGFLSAHWDGTPETEAKIKELTKATIRCIPHDAQPEEGRCILTGKPSSQRVLFARAY